MCAEGFIPSTALVRLCVERWQDEPDGANAAYLLLNAINRELDTHVGQVRTHGLPRCPSGW